MEIDLDSEWISVHNFWNGGTINNEEKNESLLIICFNLEES